MVTWTVKPVSVRSMICADIVGASVKGKEPPGSYLQGPSNSTSIVGHTRRMQSEAAEPVHLACEPEHIKRPYKLDEGVTRPTARNACQPAAWSSAGCGSCRCTATMSGTPAA